VFVNKTSQHDNTHFKQQDASARRWHPPQQRINPRNFCEVARAFIKKISEKVDTTVSRRTWQRRLQQEDVVGGGIKIELGIRSIQGADGKPGRGLVKIRAAAMIAPMTLAASKMGSDEAGKKDMKR
jgi:hypothetical protein